MMGEWCLFDNHVTGASRSAWCKTAQNGCVGSKESQHRVHFNTIRRQTGADPYWMQRQLRGHVWQIQSIRSQLCGEACACIYAVIYANRLYAGVFCAGHMRSYMRINVRGYMRVSFGGGESDVFRRWCSDDLVILRSAFGFWDSLEGDAFSWRFSWGCASRRLWGNSCKKERGSGELPRDNGTEAKCWRSYTLDEKVMMRQMLSMR